MRMEFSKEYIWDKTRKFIIERSILGAVIITIYLILLTIIILNAKPYTRASKCDAVLFSIVLTVIVVLLIMIFVMDLYLALRDIKNSDIFYSEGTIISRNDKYILSKYNHHITMIQGENGLFSSKEKLDIEPRTKVEVYYLRRSKIIISCKAIPLTEKELKRKKKLDKLMKKRSDEFRGF